MSNHDTPTYLTIPQLARRNGCSDSTYYAMIRAHTFPYPLVPFGNDVRVPLEAVLLKESGAAGEIAALRAELAVERAEREAMRESMQAIFLGLATLFAAPSPVAPSASLGAVSDIGEKCLPEEGPCRELQPVGRGATQPSIRAGGDHRRAHETRGVQPAPQLSGGRRKEVAGAALSPEHKGKRPGAATPGRVTG